MREFGGLSLSRRDPRDVVQDVQDDFARRPAPNRCVRGHPLGLSSARTGIVREVASVRSDGANVAEIALARCVARWPAQSASVTLVTSWFSNRRAWVLSHAWSPGNGGPAFRRRRGDHVGRGLGCTAAHMRRSSLRVHNGRSGDARGDSEIVLRSGSMEPQQRACGTPCKA